MARLLKNFLRGTLSADLSSVATSMSSDELADFPEIISGDYMAIVLDPAGLDGDPEIAYITWHTAGATPATTATLWRGREDTTARSHATGTTFIHAALAEDFNTGGGGGGVDLPMVQPAGIGSYDYGVPGATSFFSGLRTANPSANERMYFWSYFFEASTITEVQINVTSASSSGTARLGICTADPTDGQPLALVEDWGTVSTASLGLKTITSLSTNVSAGPHIIVAEFDEACQIRCLEGQIFGWSSIYVIASTSLNGRYATLGSITPGAFSDPPADYDTLSGSNNQNHYSGVWMKFQAQV